jgi:hypothetical protein
MTLVTGIIYGLLIALILGIIVVVGLFIYHVLYNKRYNRIIRIKNWTAGKPYVEQYRAELIKKDGMGLIYYIKQLESQNRQYVQHFGSDKEYPTNKSNEFYVPITYYNGSYSPEKYDPTDEEEIETIIYNEDLKTHEKVIKKVKIFIIKPVKASIRLFNMIQDTQIKEDYKDKQGWWDKWGTPILGFGALFILAGVGLIIFILMTHYGMEIANNTLNTMGSAVSGLGEGLKP